MVQAAYDTTESFTVTQPTEGRLDVEFGCDYFSGSGLAISVVKYRSDEQCQGWADFSNLVPTDWNNDALYITGGTNLDGTTNFTGVISRTGARACVLVGLGGFEAGYTDEEMVPVWRYVWEFAAGY